MPKVPEESSPFLKRPVRSFEEQIGREEEAVARIRERSDRGEITMEQAQREIVEVVLTRLDGHDPMIRDLLKAKLLDLVENDPYLELARQHGRAPEG